MQEEVIQVATPIVAKRRLSYRIGDKLPKPIRVLYYAVLILSLVYIIYRLVEWVLKTIQRIGKFIFDDKNYWILWLCVLILLVGAVLLGQYYFGLDPFGKVANFFIEKYNEFRAYLSNLILPTN